VLAIALQVLLLAAADGDEAGVALAQVQQVAQLVGVHRAAGAAALRVDLHVRIHEEPVHDELATAVEEVEQRRVPSAGRGEAIVLLHADHRHAAALGRHGVTRAGVRLLLHEQRLARGAPLLRGDDVGLGGAHRGLRVVVVTTRPLVRLVLRSASTSSGAHWSMGGRTVRLRAAAVVLEEQVLRHRVVLPVSWAAPVVALHPVSGAGRRFSTWNH
jgi:hypothetical protein